MQIALVGGVYTFIMLYFFTWKLYFVKQAQVFWRKSVQKLICIHC